MSTYKFDSIEFFDGVPFVEMTLVRTIEPAPIEYVKSFFGLFKPMPKVKEHKVIFVKSNDWAEINTANYCSLEMSELLDSFLALWYNNPIALDKYVGLI